MAVTIDAVSTAREKKQFIRLPWTIYAGDPHWVPPLLIERQDFLNPAKNPFFEHAAVRLFLARDAGGRIVGRIAAIDNRHHVARHGEKVGFFGLFECVDDQDTANALFDAAAGFLRDRGLEVMRGPENMSINDDVGLLIKGFDRPPFIMMPHNPPYYERLVDGYGFRKAMDLLAYYGEHDDPNPPERLQRGVAALRKRYAYTIRTVDMKRFPAEVELIKKIYNEAWEENWNAIPMTDHEFSHLAKDLKLVLDPEMCLIAEVGGEIAGFLLALPDVNRALIKMNGRLLPLGLPKLLWHKRRIDRIRVIALGILPRFRRMAISSALICETYKRGVARGYRAAELSWILETNAAMNNALINEGFIVHKTYRVYDYPL
jgi:ribosomal protein S18 acetylase RimI-like enzyme